MLYYMGLWDMWLHYMGLWDMWLHDISLSLERIT